MKRYFPRTLFFIATLILLTSGAVSVTADNAPDSTLELKFEEKAGKTTLHLHHYGLQKGDAKKYGSGWKAHYFNPMKDYFGK